MFGLNLQGIRRRRSDLLRMLPGSSESDRFVPETPPPLSINEVVNVHMHSTPISLRNIETHVFHPNEALGNLLAYSPNSV